MPNYLTFEDIYTNIERATKLSGANRDLVKEVANQVYMTEILTADDLYAPFWLRRMDDSLASVASSSISAITLEDPGVITTTAAHGLSVGDVVGVYNITGTTQLNNRQYKVNTVPSTTSLSLIDLYSYDAIDTSSMTAWSSGGTIVHRGLTLATSAINVENIIEAGWHGYNDTMKQIEIEELEESTKWLDDNTSRPKRWMLVKDYTAAGVETNLLLWFPGADAAYDLRYWAQIRVDRMVNDSDVPLLPPQFADAIVSGAITRLIESNIQVENAVVWPTIYRQQLSDIRTYNRDYYQKNLEERQKGPYLL